MLGNVVVIGAGVGGLHIAKLLAESGVSVTVYEKSARDKLSYPWRDDVSMNVFKFCKLAVPQGARHNPCAALYAPFSDAPVFVNIPEEKRDWSISRSSLAEQQINDALGVGAKIYFSTAVDSLYFEGDAVKGVVISGEVVKAELVVDSSGLNSPFRASLPQSAGITAEIAPQDKFVVTRKYVKAAEGELMPTTNTNRVYLKQNGEAGIAWCICEPDGTLNVLVGRIGKLDEAQITNGLKTLKTGNPIMGEETVKGGGIYQIPVRRPLTKLFCDGYLAMGDAAFMTMPLIGSGIGNAIRQATIFGEAIIDKKSFSKETLWACQRTLYRWFGAQNYLIDMVKRFLLASDCEDLKYFFESGMFDDTLMSALTTESDKGVKLPRAAVLKIIKTCLHRKLFVAKVVKALVKAKRIMKYALSSPAEYDEVKIAKWQAKLDGYFN